MAIPKIISAAYQLSVHRTDQLPGGELPEVAFLGRSNVGKSSLINVLLGRKKLVRTSAVPGCTRALNFFLVNSRWLFVDLPGFGYAAVSKDLKDRWGQLVLDYLGQRQALAAVVFLQDGRRRLGPEELFLWEYLRDRKRLGDSSAHQGGQVEAGRAPPAVATSGRKSGPPGGGPGRIHLVLGAQPRGAGRSLGAAPGPTGRLTQVPPSRQAHRKDGRRDAPHAGTPALQARRRRRALRPAPSGMMVRNCSGHFEMRFINPPLKKGAGGI